MKAVADPGTSRSSFLAVLLARVPRCIWPAGEVSKLSEVLETYRNSTEHSLSLTGCVWHDVDLLIVYHGRPSRVDFRKRPLRPSIEY